MKLEGIDMHCIHAKWKGVGGQAIVHGGRGWGQGGLAPPPPRKRKKEAFRGNFKLFQLCLTNEIRGDRYIIYAKWKGWADRRLSMVGGKGALPHPPPLEDEKKEMQISAN